MTDTGPLTFHPLQGCCWWSVCYKAVQGLGEVGGKMWQGGGIYEQGMAEWSRTGSGGDRIGRGLIRTYQMTERIRREKGPS